MAKIAVLTSGGDAPGMNAALRAMAKVAAARGVRVVGVQDGYDGLIDGATRELTVDAPGTPGGLAVARELDLAGNEGGTVLGSARCARFRERAHRDAAAERLRGVDGLVVIGGNGSLTGAHLFAKENAIPVVGVPASIDNDIGCTATALGVDTALNTILECCDRIADTARSHRRAFVVEVMGRQSGYLALAGAVAAGADGVLLPEHGRGEDDVVEAVAGVIRRCFARDRDRRRVLVLKAEGVEVPCTRLVRRVEESLADLGVETRATVLGHLVRGGRPTYQDRMIAGRLGLAALEAVLAGETDQMVAWTPPVPGGTPTGDPAVARFGLEDVLRETAALLDGTSPVTRWRLQALASVEGALGL
ncbi:MAG: 6-phosphofructokinase [Polyangiales bacterium]